MAYIGKAPGGTGVRQRYLYTATSGQTTFTTSDSGLALSYSDTNYMDVYQNGVLLDPANDYTATSGTSVVLGTGATTGDVIEIIVYDVFSVFNNTVTGNFTVGNNLTVSGTSTLATVDINAGNIDGTTIGAATPAAGTFTTLTASGDVNFDSNTLFVDASANAVGIGTSSPSGAFTSAGGRSFFFSGDLYGIGIAQSSGQANYAYLGSDASGNLQVSDTQGNQIATFTQDNKVGIGQSVPAGQLHLTSSDITDQVIIENTDTSAAAAPDLVLWKNSSSPADNDALGQVFFRGENSSGTATNYAAIDAVSADVTAGTEDGKLRFQTRAAGSIADRLVIDGQNVGIGTSSPDKALTISASDSQIRLYDADGTNQFASFQSDNGTTKITSRNNTSNGTIAFQRFDGTTVSESMRIDSTGNLLVGQSSTTVPGLSNTTTGLSLTNNGYIFASKADDNVAWFNRNTSDGSIISLRKDGSPVGSIGASSSSLTVATGDTGLRFVDAVDAIAPFSATTQLQTDNQTDIGRSSFRFKDLYLGGGVYVGGTSSANKLDDYEKGTWTVTLGRSGVTFSPSNTTGYYTKIGRLVYFTYYSGAITASATSQSGNTTFSGLPFTSANGTQQYHVFNYVHGNLFSSDVTGGYVNQNNTNAFFIIHDTVSAAVNVSIGSGRYLMISGVYEAA